VISKPSIIFVMGVSGSGKTTIGKLLSEKTNIPFFDADDFHSAANKEKMRIGRPLADEDRKEWLEKLNAIARDQMKTTGAVIACSALKEKYRKILSAAITIPVYWIFLSGDYELINQRMLERTNHFMPSSLLKSQFEILEIPENAVIINIAEEPARIVERIMNSL